VPVFGLGHDFAEVAGVVQKSPLADFLAFLNHRPHQGGSGRDYNPLALLWRPDRSAGYGRDTKDEERKGGDTLSSSCIFASAMWQMLCTCPA
jgi:hypothetical protein